jgi:hypothetical protein
LSTTNIYLEKSFEELKQLKSEYEQDLKVASTVQEKSLANETLRLIVEALHENMPKS